MLGRLISRASYFLRRSTDESIRADVVGALFLLGALLGAVSLVFPHPNQGEVVIWAVVAVASVIGALLLWRSTRVATPVLHGAVAAGALLINVMVLASGAASGVYAAMFCWVVLVSVNFFPLRAAVAHFTVMMGTFAVVLTLVESGSGYSPFTRWITTTLALAVTGGATAWLVFRRRLAEESEQRFIDLSQEMLCTIDADGCFRMVNPAWERTLGYPIPDLYEMPVSELIHPGDREEAERALARLRDGTEALTLENRCRGWDGTWHTLVWSASFSADESLIYARVRQRRMGPVSSLSAPPLQRVG